MKNKTKLQLLKKIWHDLCEEKNICSSDNKPHAMIECKDAKFSIKEYLKGLIYQEKKNDHP